MIPYSFFSVQGSVRYDSANYNSRKRDQLKDECEELLHLQRFEEAYQKLEAYHDVNEGFIDNKDRTFIAQVEVGFLSIKPTQKKLETAVNAWQMAAMYSNGSDRDALNDLAMELIELFQKTFSIPVIFDNFEAANVVETVSVLDFVHLSILKVGDECKLRFRQWVFLPMILGVRHLV